MVPPAKMSFVTSRNRDDVGTRVEAVIGSSLTLPIQIMSVPGEICWEDMGMCVQWDFSIEDTLGP